MARKINPVARLLAIYETLTEEQAAIAFDLLRFRQPKRPVKKSQPARPAAGRSERKRLNDTLNQSTAGMESAMNAAGDRND